MLFGQSMVLVLGFATLFSFLAVLFLVVTSRPAEVENRVSDLREESQLILAQRPARKSESVNREDLRKAWSQKEEHRKQMGERLVQAGLYKRGSTGAFVATQVALCAMPVAIGMIASVYHYTTFSKGLLMGITVGILGILGPGLWLDSMKRHRQLVIRRSLPDTLDLLVVCLEAGMSLPAALVRITRELRSAYPMLAMELIIVHREVQLGATSGEALSRFADRFDLDELRSLSSVIKQAERFGASITKAIKVHAESLRHKRLEQARERAQKATVKILFPTILCIFPSLYVVILGPAFYQVAEFFDKVPLGGKLTP